MLNDTDRRAIARHLRAIARILERAPLVPPSAEPTDALASAERVRVALIGTDHVTIADLLARLGYPPERYTRGLSTRVGRALHALGWRVDHQRGSGRRERVYRPSRADGP